MKAASGRGRKTTNQGMGRVWKKIFARHFFMQNQGGKRKNLKISPLLTQKLKNFCFFEASGRG